MTTRFISLGARAFINPGFTEGTDLQTTDGAEISWDERRFPMAQDRSVDASLNMPGGWDPTQGLKFTARLRSPSVYGDTRWRLSFSKLQEGQDRRQATLTEIESKTVTVPPQQFHDFDITFNWPSPSLSPGDLVVFELTRLGSSGYDNTGDIYLCDFWIEYEDPSGNAGLGADTLYQYDASPQCDGTNKIFSLPPTFPPYQPGKILVFRNGVKLDIQDVQEINDHAVQINVAPLSGESIQLTYVAQGAGSGSSGTPIQGHGNPNGVVTAVFGATFYDLDTGIYYRQTTSPYGTTWVII